MADIKFSIREGMVPGRNIMERFELLARVGIAGCEVTNTTSWETIEEVKAAAAATGVTPNLWSSKNIGLIQADAGARAAAVEACQEALKMAGQVGAIGFILPPLILCKMQNLTRVPDLSPLMSTAELERKLNAEIIKQWLAPVALEAGSQIVIEPLNRYEQWWPCTIEHGIDIVNDCGGPGQGVCIMADFFHMNIEDASYYDSIKAGGALIRNVHLPTASACSRASGIRTSTRASAPSRRSATATSSASSAASRAPSRSWYRSRWTTAAESGTRSEERGEARRRHLGRVARPRPRGVWGTNNSNNANAPRVSCGALALLLRPRDYLAIVQLTTVSGPLPSLLLAQTRTR